MTQPPLSRRSLIAGSAAVAALARIPHVTPTRASSLAVEDDGSLEAMLARTFDPTPDGGTGPRTLFAYAGIARQLEVRGLRHLDPTVSDRDRVREWTDGIDGLYVEDTLLQFALTDAVWGSVGFDPSQIDQTLFTGDAPRVTRLFRGRFDEAAVARALTSSGYEQIDAGGVRAFTIGEEGEFAFDHPVQSIVLSALNNVAVVGHAYVVAAAYLVDLEAQLAVLAGNAATLVNNVAVATLLSAVDEELVSATVMDGSGLSVASMPDLGVLGVATPEPAGTIAPAAAVLFGLTAGSLPSRYTDPDDPLQGDHDGTAPRAAFVVGLHLGSEAEAEAAVPVIERRLAEGRLLLTNEPYASYFEEWEVTAAAGTPVVTVRVGGEWIGRHWLQIVFARDLAFLFTE